MMRKILFAFIVISIVFSVTDYFAAQRSSYNKYLSGEYYFRYKATTILAQEPDSWMDSVEAFEKAAERDYSDTKTMLLYGGVQTVWAGNPHDGVCTVIYGDRVVEDFPVSNLRFENDDETYFYGTKKLDYKEYIEFVNSLTDGELDSERVSDRKMASYKAAKSSMIMLIAVDLAVFVILFFLYRSELDFAFNLVLIVAAVYNILLELISVFIR